MAGVLRYTSTSQSYNGETFRVEIWDKNFTGGSATTFVQGAGGPVLSYDANGDKKFSKIITSKFEFPFLVQDSSDANFINQLRTTYNERDVYVYVFNSSSTSQTPVWAGFIIMDLADEEDLYYPYEVKLKAIDGLALLKDMDFVPDITDSAPYSENETYIPLVFQKVNYFLKEILAKAGLQTYWDSASYNSYKIKTSVNWYNEEMPGTGVGDDPLELSYINSKNWYKEEEDENSLEIKYKVKNCYEVLEDICKTWGMRCIYWSGSVHFIQISEYTNSETGTVASTVNITTRTYNRLGTFESSAVNLGTENVLYDLRFEATADLGLQKLTGTNYSFYPPVKEVTTKHLLVSNQNNFTVFPLFPNNGESTVNTTDWYETASLGIFTDAKDFDGFFQRISLMFNNPSGNPRQMQMNWTIRARESGTSTWTKMIKVNGSGGLYWGSFVQPTSNPFPTPTLVFQTQITITNGVHNINICSNEIGAGNIPTDSAFTGDWEFEYYTHTQTGANNGHYNGHAGIEAVLAQGLIVLPPMTGLWAAFGISYSNINGSNSMFSPVFNGVVGVNSQSVLYTTVDNSYKIDLKELPFGDNDIATAGAMIVATGSTTPGLDFVLTDFTGKWGVGTLLGDDTITLLLCKEILNNQNTESYKLNTTTVLSITNKTITSGGSSAIKQINPIGRLLDKDGTPYVFLRGDFNFLTDEVSGEWFEFDYIIASGVATNYYNNGLNSGIVLGGSAPTTTAQAMVIPAPTVTPSNVVFATVTTYVPVSSSPITTLDVSGMITSTFKSGDVLELFNAAKNKRYKLTLTADFNTGDTAITFSSLAFDVDINVGSIIQIDDLDLAVKYQNKTLQDVVDKGNIVIHRSAQDDDHAIELDVFADGFGDVKALSIAYTTGDIGTGSDDGVIVVSVDEVDSTGGDIAALEVITTDEGSSNVYALKTAATVNPVQQLSGVLVNADSILTNVEDVRAALSTGGAGNISIFSADNDTITIGSSAKFEELEIILSTVASGAGVKPVFEFSTGVGSWEVFIPVDGTNSFKNSGGILWEDVDVFAWAVGTGSEYLIRITRTKNSLTTTPIATLIHVAALTEYIWDKSGNISLNNIVSNGNIGIGTATPTTKLEVVGDAKITTNLEVNGTEIDFTNVPTTDPGITGRVWQDEGILKISI